MYLHPAFVCLIVFGTILRGSDAVVAYTDKTATIAEDKTGTLATVTATTGAANGNTVAFTVATTGGLAWLAVTASGSNCVVSLKSGETLNYEDANLPGNKQYLATVTAQEKDSSDSNVGSAVTFTVTLTITDVLELSGLTPTIKENLAGGALVTTVDTDGAGTYTFAISSQTPDSGWFTIASAAGANAAMTVVTGQTVNYEDTGLSSHTYKVVVVATKSDSSASATGTVVITITDTNDFASGLTASVLHGTTTGEVTKITTTPADAAVALVSQNPDIGWFTITNKVISVAASKTIDSTNSAVITACNKYRVVLTVGAAGASQGTGTVTITITTSGVTSVIGNGMLTLGLLLVSKIFL